MNITRNKKKLSLRLFVVPDSEYCTIAKKHLDEFIARVKGKFDIEFDVIDIMKNAQTAEDEGIIVTPTLIKKHPVPEQRLVGSFKQVADLLNI